jgi:hypothetical protein
MARMIIDLQKGLIEVEGDEKLVERVYSDLKEITLDKLSNGTFDAPRDERDEIAEDAEKPSRTPRRRAKAGGPSCASRIETLKKEAFFAAGRSVGDVRNKLREKGSTYESKNVAAALTNLTKAGKLRRFNEGGWKYQNP